RAVAAVREVHRALHPAAATVVGIVLEVPLAPVGGVVVAVLEPGVADERALAHRAARRRVHRAALPAARAAVPEVGGERRLAAVHVVAVAVAIVGEALRDAGAGHAGGLGV